MSTDQSLHTTDVDNQDDETIVATTGRAARRGSFGPGSAGMPAEKTRDLKTVMRRLGTILEQERVWYLPIAVLTFGSVALVVLGPRLLGQATDIIVDGSLDGSVDFTALHRSLTVIALIYLGGWALGYGQAYILAGVVQRAMKRLRGTVEDKLHRVPLSYVDAQDRGDLLSRVTNDIDNLAQALQQTTSQILSSALTLVGVAVMMIIVSPPLAAIALVIVPVTLWLMQFIGGRARPMFIAQWRYTGSVNAQAEEAFTGHAIVKSFGRQRDVEAQFEQDNESLYEASFAAQFTASLIQPAMAFMGNVQFVIVAVVGGLRVASGGASIGDVQALIQYARQFSMPLTRLASMTATFQSGMASLERVLEIIDAPEQSPEQADTIDGDPVVGRVVFDDVRFSYSPDTTLIEGLNLIAEPGQTVAIVGPTGAGKTTLVNLLMRFYDLDGGAILLDGRDISTYPRAELRSRIGMVLQDTWLFGGSIRENLAYGNPDATETQLMEAAKITFVDRFVRALPHGYDTVINDEADNISAGEKQLITIARAFLADPAILILDEATSSVDTRTEVLIQEAMEALRSKRTSFVIAHRLSTIRNADVILVMDGGRIVEQGSHNELILRDGPYARLQDAQFAGQAT
ncbi:MAG: ATP-binding cassette subfamily B multidrug efflux pump [Nitriliruptoraceae bacterium]|jgi:ATP-binding cassette subfamily B multidrug efflux pump